MKFITEEQAVNYVKAGIYPPDTYESLAEIVDLQDMYGHQNYWLIIGLLVNPETRDNAERLFRLIWNGEDVDRYVKYAEKHIRLIEEKRKLEEALARVNKELNYDHVVEF